LIKSHWRTALNGGRRVDLDAGALLEELILMIFWTKITESIFNPFVWVLLAALAFFSYDSYRRSQELNRVCALTGPHEIAVPIARTRHEEIDNICASRQPDVVPSR
jgi:hypothetical protein